MTLDDGSAPASIWIRASHSPRPVGSPQAGDTLRHLVVDRDPTSGPGPTRLQRLYVEQDHSPWLDGLARDDLADSRLSRLVAAGVRGVTANPTTFAKAVEGSSEYDEQLTWLTLTGCSVEEAYWELVAVDTIAACAVLRPVHRSSHGTDGFVSVEVSPALSHDTHATIVAARGLHQRIDHENLLVKVPATAQGVSAIRSLVAGGRNINVTLLFSLGRYADVIEAYLSGLETFISRGGDPSRIHSVASFFVGRVDAEIDQRLERSVGASGHALAGRAGVAQAKLAYQLFNERFAGKRWDRLASHGANPQRLLWASTTPKNPAYRDTRYVEELIGPQTVSTLPERTLDAFQDHGTVARTIDVGVPDALGVMEELKGTGIDMDEVGLTLEEQGVAGFKRSFQGVMAELDAKRQRLGCA